MPRSDGGVCVGTQCDTLGGDYAIAMGWIANANATDAFALGRQADATAEKSMAFGGDATTGAQATATSAVQFGDGTNADADTIQYKDKKILTHSTTINETTTERIFSAADAPNKWLRCTNASATDLIIPPNSVIPFPVGTKFNIVSTQSTHIFNDYAATGTPQYISAGGTGYSNGTAVATTGGTGSGMTVDITQTAGVIDSIRVNATGSGYAAGDVVTVSTGGANATFTLVDINDILSITSGTATALEKVGTDEFDKVTS